MVTSTRRRVKRQQPSFILAVTRGRIWLDESLSPLSEELRRSNFWVDVVPKEMELSKVKQLVVDGRFLTARRRDFLEDINAYEYCLIDVHWLQYLPPAELADLVSLAWI